MNVGEPGTDAHLDYLQALLAPYTRRSTDAIAEPAQAPDAEPSVFVSPPVEEILPPTGSSDPGDAPVIDLRLPKPQTKDAVAAPPASGEGRHARRQPPARPVTDDHAETDETAEAAETEMDEEAAPLQRRSAQ